MTQTSSSNGNFIMSYPSDDPSTFEKVGIALAFGFCGVAGFIIIGFIGFLYYEAVRTLLTWGPSTFNMSILGITLVWLILSTIIYYEE